MQKNKPFCFRNKYCTPNINPYSICLECKFRVDCTTPEDKEPVKSDYDTRQRNLRNREEKTRKIITSTLEQLELYHFTLEEDIGLTEIYSEDERNCCKKQLQLCNDIIDFIKKRIGD
jgi:hypothetical protein